MAVIIKRSTNSAPDSLSTSYFTGSAFIGISIITLNSCGTCLPAFTSLMLISRRSSGLRANCASAHHNPKERSSSVDGDVPGFTTRCERRVTDLGQRPGRHIDGIHGNVIGVIVRYIGKLARWIEHEVER